MKKEIKFEDVKCQTTKKHIERLRQAADRFIWAVNLNLSDKEKISRDARDEIITVSSCNAYKDDGNTRTPGEEYTVILGYRFDDDKTSINRMCYEKGYVENTIYFILNEKVRINDQIVWSRFLEMFVSGYEYSEGGSIHSGVRRIAYNNDNMELTSIFNPKTATEAVMEIRKNNEKRFLLKMYQSDDIYDVSFKEDGDE